MQEKNFLGTAGSSSNIQSFVDLEVNVTAYQESGTKFYRNEEIGIQMYSLSYTSRRVEKCA